MTVRRYLRRLYAMKRTLPFIVYTFALTAEIARVLFLSLSQKSFSAELPVSSFAGLALLCLPAVFWFMLLQNEDEFHTLLRIIALIKFFCIVSSYVFLAKTGRLLGYASADTAALKLQYAFTWALLPVDALILFFSLVREKYLCR